MSTVTLTKAIYVATPYGLAPALYGSNRARLHEQATARYGADAYTLRQTTSTLGSHLECYALTLGRIELREDTFGGPLVAVPDGTDVEPWECIDL